MQYKQFAVYQCSSCARQIEVQQDPTSPGPTRCNITYKCPGLLSLVNTKSVRTELFPPIVFGLQDYIQRGTTLATPTPAVTVAQADLMNSSAGSLVMSAVNVDTSANTNHFWVTEIQGGQIYTETTVLNPLQLPVTTEITLNLYELTADILQYSQYVYNRGSNVQFVQGADDSAQSQNLFFTTGDEVRVFLNGVEMSSSQFNTGVANQITFTPMLTGTSNIIEVYVYQDITTLISDATLIPLTFRQLNVGTAEDLAFRDENGWGDTGAISIQGGVKYLLYCTDLSNLDLSASYGISTATTTSETGVPITLDLSKLNLLISYPPYGFADKDLNHFVPISVLATQDGVLTLSQGAQTGLLQITCAQDYVTNTFSQLTVEVPVAGVTSQETAGTSLAITPISNTFILGPS